MFKNYITVAIRSLMRHKLYATINICGLALGLACCILMALFVTYEWSHDRFHQNKNHIYRLGANEPRSNGEDFHRTYHPISIIEALPQKVPGIKHISGFIKTRIRITGNDQTFQEQFGEIHPDFLKMFSFPLVVGNIETAMAQPDAVLITESMANKFFGDQNGDYSQVVGQTLTFHGKQDQSFIITGILKDIPQNSSLQFACLIPIEHHKNYGKAAMNDRFISVYIQLVKQQIPAAFEAQLPAFIDAYETSRMSETGRKKYEYTAYLEPITDIYWHSKSDYIDYEKTGNPFAAYLLSAIAGLVLLIACSNFMSISIARSTNRAKEVGVRKVVGARRVQLMQQFWGEAILSTVLALGLGIALTELFLPIFNGLIQRELTISYLSDGIFIMIAGVLILAVGLIAGSYPAVVLSRFRPVESLKGQTRLGGRSNVTRVLVILQYAASIALMVCTGVIMSQQEYIQNKNLGYDKEQVLVIHLRGFEDKFEVTKRYKQAILSHHNVIGATVSDRTFTNGWYSNSYRKTESSPKIWVWVQKVDYDYINTMDITLLDGRNFSEDHPTDRGQSVIINETMAKAIGMEDPVGKTLTGKVGGRKDATIIGVVRDFHATSLYRPIAPLMLKMGQGAAVLIRIRPNDMTQTLAYLEQTWNKVAPHWAFEYTFLDENLDAQYRDEQRWQSILTCSAFFAIAISCLGLLGLASLAVSKRTKEIGIRKVLGASVPNLVNLLSKDFVKLLVLANIIAWPTAYYAMNQWLANFAYRIELSIGIFALSTLLALGIALFTVCLQTLKAAHKNPVDALRYE